MGFLFVWGFGFFGFVVFGGFFCTQVSQCKFFRPIISIVIFQIHPIKVFEKDTGSITCNMGVTFKRCLGKQQANNSCHRVGRRCFVGSVKFAHLSIQSVGVIVSNLFQQISITIKLPTFGDGNFHKLTLFSKIRFRFFIVKKTVLFRQVSAVAYLSVVFHKSLY